MFRQASEDSDGDYYRDSSSDGSSDYEFEKSMKFSRELHGSTNEILSRIGSLSISDEHSTTQEGSSSDDGEAGNSRDHLMFEFFEQDTPYIREPLTDKASCYSISVYLVTLCSDDLSTSCLIGFLYCYDRFGILHASILGCIR